MRHHQSTRKLGRNREQRQALLRGLAVALIKNGRIKTTEAKAKELRPWIEPLITKSKTPTLAKERLITAVLGERSATAKLVKEIGPRFIGRPGGYTRIIKLPRRGGDAAAMAMIEFTA